MCQILACLPCKGPQVEIRTLAELRAAGISPVVNTAVPEATPSLDQLLKSLDRDEARNISTVSQVPLKLFRLCTGSTAGTLSWQNKLQLVSSGSLNGTVSDMC